LKFYGTPLAAGSCVAAKEQCREATRGQARFSSREE